MSALSSTTSANENGFKAFVKMNPLISMFGLRFLLAWPFLILEALASRGLTSRPPDILGFATGWVPALATIIVASMLAGRSGVKEGFRRFLIWRVGVQWYIVALFLLVVLILGGIGLHVLFGGAMPVIPAAGAPPWQIAFAFVVTVLLGVLINTEEIAWRGFALPRLQASEVWDKNVRAQRCVPALPQTDLQRLQVCSLEYRRWRKSSLEARWDSCAKHTASMRLTPKRSTRHLPIFSSRSE